MSRRRHARLVEAAKKFAAQVDSLLSNCERSGATVRDAMAFLGEQDAKRDWSTPAPYEMHAPRNAAGSTKGSSKGKGGMKRMASVRWFEEVRTTAEDWRLKWRLET